ncbi:hypothetical protein PstZobell_01562 [Stutzerimonas stutzeri ATCC 14405 = CCUG 16156]|nr:hypothetical protein PstZobell_01562 [Stutzerimonas stutzeri ATCC 14405 = CCUG 16156]QOZ96006.1 hypothetical protein Pstu14405_11995 [Stutzerimonas stutzeri]
MPKTISELQERKIANMIRNWDESHALNWENICVGAQGILGWVKPPTRQALDKKIVIKISYQNKKERLRAQRRNLGSISKPRSTLDALKKIIRLQEENDALKSELTKMAELANLLIYNASIAGLTRERLLSPLPSLQEPASKPKRIT